jgi:hypothetical protein
LGTVVTARSALSAAKANKKVRAVALVSAFLDSAGLRIIEESPDLPILVVVSMQDAIAGSQAKQIYDTSKNQNSEIEVYINAGEGNQIWQSYVIFEMAEKITDWFWTLLSEPVT